MSEPSGPVRAWCCNTVVGEPHTAGCDQEPTPDNGPDWSEILSGGPGGVWTLPEPMTITSTSIDGDHWQRLIDIANTAAADLAIQYGCKLLSSILLIETYEPDFDAAWRHAATLAHLVHPWTIAADTGHPTEADYYREEVR